MGGATVSGRTLRVGNLDLTPVTHRNGFFAESNLLGWPEFCWLDVLQVVLQAPPDTPMYLFTRQGVSTISREFEA